MRIPRLSRLPLIASFLRLTLLSGALTFAAACSGGAPAPPAGTPVVGQTDFVSAPPAGRGGGNSASFGAAGGGVALNASASTSTSSAAAPAASGGTGTARTVQETDLYRFDAATNRLYYLNSYRGLMVFDLTNVDQPKLLGRSPIFGTPVQMFVQGTTAVVVVADWYGTLDSGAPFHGSIVRGLDASDPANIKVIGDAKLGGWIQDTRVVGNILYAVSEDYGWTYGWWGGGGVAFGAPAIGGSSSASVIVSSVNFAGGAITAVSSKTYAGYGAVFNVTPSSIMLAHPAPPGDSGVAPAQTVLQYLDITDPNGAIAERGSITVDGAVEGWGPDNGRWNLDFADGKTAHTIGSLDTYASSGSNFVLATADFSNPDAPVLDSTLPIASPGWTPAARFDSQRMYLSESSYSSASGTTPLQIYDLSKPTAPALAGQTTIPGSVWLILPSGNQLFALGQDTTASTSSSQVSLKYLDVTDATKPTLIGMSNFGSGWAWTPAADTFKAFVRGTTLDGSQGLVLLPFSGWSWNAQQYNNGVQLIE
ncbi:MAG TPA: beta-propeller domain-containing protein, partial [Polyangiaceae bacterium]|nr:beta-propeller domain-containing protein [Polyangiaceae bacterium]